MNIKHLLAALPFLVSWCALAAPFTVSADGQEVTDAKTGLIWRRCVEGMTASAGGCTGSLGGFTHEAALVRASTQAAATGVAWRLPNVKELSSIADKSRSDPAMDETAFPDARASLPFWSSSPYAGSASAAWCATYTNGLVRTCSRDSIIYVRLVRAGQ